MWTARAAAIVVSEERPCAARGGLLRVLRARASVSSTKRSPEPSTVAGAHRGDPLPLRAKQPQLPLLGVETSEGSHDGLLHPELIGCLPRVEFALHDPGGIALAFR